MKRVSPLLIFFFLLSSCNKKESNFQWERTFGKGEAYLAKSAADSGFYSCGRSEGKPYFIRFDKNRSKVIEISGSETGLFSSVWFDTSSYIPAGSSNGHLRIFRYDNTGRLKWQLAPDAGFRVDFASLFETGGGELLAIGTSGRDSSGTTGVCFVRFDTTGTILQEMKYPAAWPTWSGKAVTDNSGNVYLAATRKIESANSRAVILKYNIESGKIWERELFNNPSFSSSCTAAMTDASGTLYITGQTEILKDGIRVGNSFVFALSAAGESSIWNEKIYPEYYNSGSALLKDISGNLLVLNRNCLVISIVNPADGSLAGTLRPFSVCVSESTDALGNDFDECYDNSLLLAGSLGGSYYLAIKTVL